MEIVTKFQSFFATISAFHINVLVFIHSINSKQPLVLHFIKCKWTNSNGIYEHRFRKTLLKHNWAIFEDHYIL